MPTLRLILLVCAALPCLPAATQAPPAIPEDAPATLDVLSYNVFLRGPSLFFRDDHDRRSRGIPAALVGYDVVVLQEAFSDAHRRRILDALASAYPYHTRVVGRDRFFKQDGGVILLSRWPIEVEDQRVFDACTQSDCWAQKGVVYARIRKGDRRYHLFGAHLQAEYGNSDRAKILSVRTRQLQTVRALIDSLAIPQDEAVLIAGDFNIDLLRRDPDGEFGSMLATLDAGLPPPRPGPDPAASYDGPNNTVASSSTSERLDYVFYSRAHALPTRAFNEVLRLRDAAGLDLSDHHAVHGHFSYGGAAVAAPGR
jgi:endonuclease/exonuclease/phosphatase family metal-dependent hydrolase